MKAIGIDIGTTSISAVALDTDEERVLTSVTVPSESFIDTGKDWERIQDVSVIIRKAKESLDNLLDKYPDAACIGLTGQMHGILYTDADGHCISPLYTWQDQRAALPAASGSKPLIDEIRDTCHLKVAAGYGVATHIFQCRNGKQPLNAASICTVPDYLAMVLTGRRYPLLHASMAASMGFFDVKKCVFQTDLLDILGIDGSILPDVTDQIAVAGAYRGIPVTVALGDNQASFLGSVGMQENTVLLNVGTGSQISVLSNIHFESEEIEARPLTDGKFILVGSSLCGGRAYAILEKFFRQYVLALGGEDQSQYDVMARLAEKKQGEDSMRVVTTFNGTRVNPNLRGSISNLTEDNFTPEGMVQGVLRGIAEELYEMFDKIHTGTGIEARSLVASGNGARKNIALQKIFEERFQAELRLAKYEEEAACGAALSSFFHGKEI